jgi:ribokinase
MSKPVMVCIGKAGQDVFLQGEVFKPFKDEGVFYEHIKLGEKFYVDSATYAVGGNAANASITFARQGLEVSFICKVGDDPAGHTILNALDKEHINTRSVVIDKDEKSSFSTILLAPGGERTILDYPGTALLKQGDIDFDDLNEDWLYVSSVGSMKLLKKIMKTAFENEMKIAFNPASYELKHLQECADLLQYVELFAVNKEEAQKFVDGKTLKSLAKQLAESVKYVLVSDGPRGSVATDGLKVVTAGMYEDVPVIDRTGAGDAFTSGFVSQIALGKQIEEAITFASANSTSVVGKIGASAGVLRGHSKIHNMPLTTETISDKH